MDHWILSYKSPAEAWNEALPLGNGTFGVMSYGRLENETFELNLDTLWSGDGSSFPGSPGTETSSWDFTGK